ncbi:MAG: Histone acetyltransferase Elp3-like protein [Candidatus Magasanikbacteria bacterium GW2011_GWC2_37_14]|uniref:tRNA carboxymethyluridine synthase n=1 Tax=Candidatus Magasanikbacteria bacterium GW2011_GWC2_37_14 TaxID=1619046 RepID=A0A0G0JJG9_9BACT|nr:MAG: Histone acetyltransferase Elp3-like protein [Candidatus Magasanikbacteria bacterium GW2011_GWC2_37_14]
MEGLEEILLKIILQNPANGEVFYNLLRKETNKLKTSIPPKRELIIAYQKLIKNKRAVPNKHFEFLLRKAQIRTLSGVAVITSLVKPYNCPGNCVYCPSEARMPKSYLASEPAAARALGLKFNPYEQMRQRILMLEQNGHPTDKIEYIIKGGSWNAYPLKYQYWFILESFRACNELSSRTLRSKGCGDPKDSQKKTGIASSRSSETRNDSLEQLRQQLKIEQRKNETSKHRIIGLTLETRPDCVTPTTIVHMREQGCTRIELGLQAPDDKILKLVDRGHTVQQFKDAMLLLRQAGFKVDLHFMPDLPGTTAKHDVEMYKLLFSDPGLKPDMVKIYPCTVIKSAPLYKWYKAGKYKPYSEHKLFEALIAMKLATPRYCRISRLIRDIPENEISGGNIITNLRQHLATEMKNRGLKCQCLRCREIGHQQDLRLKTEDLRLFTDKYETTGGTEYFLSYEDKNRQVVFAFLRLRLPTVIASPARAGRGNPNVLNTSMGIASSPSGASRNDTAFIRELHTYGQLMTLKHEHIKALKQKNDVQHTGFGKKLVLEAEKIAKKNHYQKLSIISGVGVRGYYRKLGYKLEKTYMTKKIST